MGFRCQIGRISSASFRRFGGCYTVFVCQVNGLKNRLWNDIHVACQIERERRCTLIKPSAVSGDRLSICRGVVCSDAAKRYKFITRIFLTPTEKGGIWEGGSHARGFPWCTIYVTMSNYVPSTRVYRRLRGTTFYGQLNRPVSRYVTKVYLRLSSSSNLVVSQLVIVLFNVPSFCHSISHYMSVTAFYTRF